MKKLFLAICFIIAGSSQLQARVQEVLDMSSVPQPQQQTQTTNPKVTEVSADGLGKFLMTRIQSTVIQDPKDVKTEAMFVAPSDDPVGVEEEKGTFQKIYEEAMQRATAGEQYQGQREDLAAISADMADTREQQQQEWDVPDFPVINALLPPDNRREVVPAREHIPYLMTNIEILSNGMTKFNETVVVVANGKKLRHGLTKALPKYIYSRENKPQKVDYSLLGVTVNDQPIEYKMVEQGERILFIPQNDYELEPGVYTYNFKYVNSQGIWDYGDFKEFYWDVNGSAWNLIVAKAAQRLLCRRDCAAGAGILSGVSAISAQRLDYAGTRKRHDLRLCGAKSAFHRRRISSDYLFAGRCRYESDLQPKADAENRPLFGYFIQPFRTGGHLDFICRFLEVY